MGPIREIKKSSKEGLRVLIREGGSKFQNRGEAYYSGGLIRWGRGILEQEEGVGLKKEGSQRSMKGDWR